MAFQIDQLLTASFKIELFDREIIRVEHVKEPLPEPRPLLRVLLPQRERIYFPLVTPNETPTAWPVPPPPKASSEDIFCPEPPVPDLRVPSLDQFPPLPPVPTKPDPECDVILCTFEKMPELIGGLAALLREVQYPVIAQRAGIEGRVILQFIVDEQGRVNEPKVIRGIGGGCDEEAVRALQTVRFRPARQRGKPVKVKMSLPVTFELR
ncbi:MAG: energy transducer TonB [Bacteroidetes bacterium]|nr:energy transducer TonB [Bacteroidota bacterium]